MQVLQAILLGIVQGATEFLPVSSSGHLRVIQEFFGIADKFGLAFDTMVHLATLLAVVVYFRDDLAHMVRAFFARDASLARDRRLAWLLIIGTVPTGIIGLAGGDFFESADILYVGIAFLITSAALTAADALSRKSLHAAEGLGWGRAVLVGIAQGIAIMPGISRAGATMAMGLGVGLDREQAARFSFLLSGPIILLAGAKQALEIAGGDASLPGLAVSAAGFAAAALTGYAAIAGLMAFVKRHSFAVFAAYTAVIGVSVLVWRLTG
ncbi:MAG: undecaprenyl-diphosphate phosphatase [Anaerosomatales bacterium]|nr:undecaprenyl-diphosphate phosphatase [Anaerosomatales bacterium]MDT8433367.1 undecaprenyl-diphosphate phosphatase [Anaerosomatales bacterium]